MRSELENLVKLDRETRLVAHIGSVLSWDQETYMPEKAVEERAEQLAFIGELAHEKSVRPEIGTLLEGLGSTSADPGGDASLSTLERAYLRVMRRAWDRDTKLPGDLVAEIARTTSLAQAAWVDAKKNDDFAAFAPHLEKVLVLMTRSAACIDPKKPAYDVLLDLYEPGSTEASIGSVFDRLRSDLVTLLDRIRARPQVDDSFLTRRVGEGRQKEISAWLMDLLAFDRGRGRLDESAHPFTTTLGTEDVRITTRYIEDFLPSSVFSTIHETGHALYELGIDPGPKWKGTSLADAASMAVHESQSRMWENVVGRSLGFWKRNFGRLAELAGPALDGVGAGDFVRAVSKVEPSLIRTEADEVTYCLHVILRFELESALLSGGLEVKDLPAAWKTKARDLLGIDVPDDRRGCLQDVHWSAGLFGYFPSYALGNLYAAQFWDAMKRELPDIEGRIEAGDSAALLSWLAKNIHQPGLTWLPGELVERVTGAPLDPTHFIAYLEGKYKRVYGF
jgi:carboxypeptidase Taq